MVSVLFNGQQRQQRSQQQVLLWAREETCADYDSKAPTAAATWKVCLKVRQPIHRSSQGMTGRASWVEGGLRNQSTRMMCSTPLSLSPSPAWMSKEITEGEGKMFLTILQAALPSWGGHITCPCRRARGGYGFPQLALVPMGCICRIQMSLSLKIFIQKL